MAKAENIRDDGGLLGGLSFGASKQAAEDGVKTQTAPAPVVAATPVPQAEQMSQILRKSYQENSRIERRNIKLNIMITPTMSKMLDNASQSGEIKSKNDLINSLLEQFFGK